MEEGTRKYIPSYLRERYQLLGTVTFAALFSVLFLLVSIPFSNNAWFRLGNSTFFGFTALFASLSLAILIASKVTMYKTRNLLPMTYWGYSAWCLSEIALIAVLYTVFTVTIAQPEDQNGIAIFSTPWSIPSSAWESPTSLPACSSPSSTRTGPSG